MVPRSRYKPCWLNHSSVHCIQLDDHVTDIHPDPVATAVLAEAMLTGWSLTAASVSSGTPNPD
ncbi:hypothetical protein ABH37_18200 [Mycobacterium haemophilum]|uniref:Uncharacterized protein n=1 Tax=Mycobacterium haemophilum TaxID=29311 RepID=A0A0I9YD49_9MYCO|nr:hypothetical protein ABH39_18085 [Mycobacterium haemophilum]KLO37822.1 hypothetical protein ABH38_07730 [Mycobacterium haemophilum]KLO39515.1 hypothetical protein ABH37_18200 [Mycobacterium haemophilum]KLO55643.1 hypothetical protein ABH36_06685 [Mycobacterium haemophilum]